MTELSAFSKMRASGQSLWIKLADEANFAAGDFDAVLASRASLIAKRRDHIIGHVFYILWTLGGSNP